VGLPAPSFSAPMPDYNPKRADLSPLLSSFLTPALGWTFKDRLIILWTFSGEKQRWPCGFPKSFYFNLTREKQPAWFEQSDSFSFYNFIILLFF
jgi:hypothetical protein